MLAPRKQKSSPFDDKRMGESWCDLPNKKQTPTHSLSLSLPAPIRYITYKTPRKFWDLHHRPNVRQTPTPHFHYQGNIRTRVLLATRGVPPRTLDRLRPGRSASHGLVGGGGLEQGGGGGEMGNGGIHQPITHCKGWNPFPSLSLPRLAGLAKPNPR
jgi:hypothetical protein